MMKMHDRIFIGVPCMTRNVDVDCATAIFRKARELDCAVYFHYQISDIALARNIVAHRFMQSGCDWFQMIDSDIVFSDDDWNYLWQGPEDIVLAPYARKIPGASPATFGGGFARIHRQVFQAIDDLENEQGGELAQRFYMDSEIYTHYFPNGVTGDSRWLGEDRGFWTLCAMTGTKYRVEERCRLQHVGTFLYGYPDQSNGVQFWSPQVSENEEARAERNLFDTPLGT